MIEIDGAFEEWQNLIREAIRLLENRDQELYQDALEPIENDIRAQFSAGGTPGWAPLKPATIKAKARAGFPRLNRRGAAPVGLMQRGAFGPQNILIRTGAMFSSYTNRADPSATSSVQNDTIERGSNVKYAAVHQYGSGKVPARPLVISEQTVETIANRLLSRLIQEGQK